MVFLQIDDQLAERLRAMAEREGRDMQTMVTEALLEIVQREESPVSLVEEARAAARAASPEFIHLIEQMTPDEALEALLGLYDEPSVPSLSSDTDEKIAHAIQNKK